MPGTVAGLSVVVVDELDLAPEDPPLALTSSRHEAPSPISAALRCRRGARVRLIPKPILSGCCASAVPVSANAMHRRLRTRLEWSEN